MFKKVSLPGYHWCSECGYNHGGKAIIKQAAYIVPWRFSDRLFSGDDVNTTNARFLCEHHFKQSKFNDTKYIFNVGRLVTRSQSAS